MFNDPSSFKISSDNIVSEGRRRSIGTEWGKRNGLTPERSPSTNSRTVDQSAHEEVREALIMDEDKILPILGDLAGYKDQLDDCLETDVSKLRTLPELDELKKEVKQLKADIQKSVSKLEYLNKEPGKVAEFKVLVDRGKKFITTIDTRKQKVTEELSKNNDEETFSRVRILHSSLETVTTVKFSPIFNYFNLILNNSDFSEEV